MVSCSLFSQALIVHFCLCFINSRKQGYDKHGEGYPAPKSEARGSQHHRRQHQEQRTYPAPGQYRKPSLPSAASDAPSSVNADTYKRDKATLDIREEPAEQPNAFGGTGTYPQDSATDYRQDTPSTQSNRTRFV